jgi:hypothetical protein
MAQLSLFPTPGAIPEMLPSVVLEAARELLAEVLIVVAEKETEPQATAAGEKHEQD